MTIEATRATITHIKVKDIGPHVTAKETFDHYYVLSYTIRISPTKRIEHGAGFHDLSYLETLRTRGNQIDVMSNHVYYVPDSEWRYLADQIEERLN